LFIINLLNVYICFLFGNGLGSDLDTEDLKKFLVVAEKSNLQIASNELNVTPGALSKVIKRIENKLNTPLFERTGRNIRLNQQGDKFRQYALLLVHETEQALSEFNGAAHKTTVKISGPSLLLQHYLSQILTHFNDREFEFNIEQCWEGKAINRVETGQSHLALVTPVAMNDSNHNGDFARISIGQTNYEVVASNSHPLVKQFPDRKLSSKQLNPFGFACPNVSPFCGVKRGVGSDNWRDDKVPRNINYRCNDFSVLLSLVSRGLALAYVPEFVAKSHDLQIIDVYDYGYECQEKVELVYKPSLAFGWLNQFSQNWISNSE